MEKWYRAMVVFTALAAVLCTSAAAYAGIRLSRIRVNGWTAQEDGFVWNTGAYRVEGDFEDGALERLYIQKLHEIQDENSD